MPRTWADCGGLSNKIVAMTAGNEARNALAYRMPRMPRRVRRERTIGRSVNQETKAAHTGGERLAMS
jgi:hypothetical protein